MCEEVRLLQRTIFAMRASELFVWEKTIRHRLLFKAASNPLFCELMMFISQAYLNMTVTVNIKLTALLLLLTVAFLPLKAYHIMSFKFDSRCVLC